MVLMQEVCYDIITVLSGSWEMGCPRRGSLRRWHSGWVLMGENDQFSEEKQKGWRVDQPLASPANWRVSAARKISTSKRSAKELGEGSGNGSSWRVLSKRGTWSDGHLQKSALALVWSRYQSQHGSREAWGEATAGSSALSLIKWNGKARNNC